MSVTVILVFQAIDPRTRMVLFKMLNRGVFHDINGCISTGKEVMFSPLSSFISYEGMHAHIFILSFSSYFCTKHVAS